MAQYAENTKVPVEKTQTEIRNLVRAHGADKFLFFEDDDRGGAVIQFFLSDRMIRFHLPLPSRYEKRFTQTPAKGWKRSEYTAEKEWLQACRANWRGLYLIIKAKLEAISLGISIFDDEFMANIVLSDNKTVGQRVRPRIQLEYETGAPVAMLPAPDNEE